MSLRKIGAGRYAIRLKGVTYEVAESEFGWYWLELPNGADGSYFATRRETIAHLKRHVGVV